MYRFSLVFVLVSTAYLLSAQDVVIPTENMMSFTSTSSEKVSASSKPFFTDTDNKIFFIDFQSFNVNLNEIIVKDQSGKVVLEEKVFDLPVDTIYELDLTKFKSGKYAVELKSFAKTIRQNVVVK